MVHSAATAGNNLTPPTPRDLRASFVTLLVHILAIYIHPRHTLIIANNLHILNCISFYILDHVMSCYVMSCGVCCVGGTGDGIHRKHAPSYLPTIPIAIPTRHMEEELVSGGKDAVIAADRHSKGAGRYGCYCQCCIL